MICRASLAGHAPAAEELFSQPSHQPFQEEEVSGKYINWDYIFGPVLLLKRKAQHWLLICLGIVGLTSPFFLLSEYQNNSLRSKFAAALLVFAVGCVVVVWILIVVPLVWMYRLLEQVLWRRLLRNKIKTFLRHRFWKRRLKKCYVG